MRKSPQPSKSPTPKGAGLKNEMPKNGSRHKNPKMAAECADKSLDHGGRMSSKQILDIHGSEARVRPRHHRPVPSQYKRW